MAQREELQVSRSQSEIVHRGCRTLFATTVPRVCRRWPLQTPLLLQQLLKTAPTETVVHAHAQPSVDEP